MTPLLMAGRQIVPDYAPDWGRPISTDGTERGLARRSKDQSAQGKMLAGQLRWSMFPSSFARHPPSLARFNH